MDADALTKEKLEEISRRWDGKNEGTYDDAVRDVQALVKEVERLRGATVSFDAMWQWARDTGTVSD